MGEGSLLEGSHTQYINSTSLRTADLTGERTPSGSTSNHPLHISGSMHSPCILASRQLTLGDLTSMARLKYFLLLLSSRMCQHVPL